MKRLAKPPLFLRPFIALTAVICFIASIGHERVAAQAPTTFTITGTVTDTTGNPVPDVMLLLLSDVTGTQIAFTDQNGNYVLNYAAGVSHSLHISASKSGYIFNPLLTIFVSSGTVSGDKSMSFVGTPLIVALITPPPILLTREGSLQALALDSVTWASEIFGIANEHNFSTDGRTRISLFAVNVELRQGEPLSVIEVQAENSVGQIFPLTVEYFGAVPNFTWLKQIVVKLPDEIANSVDVRMSLKVRTMSGNKVTVKVNP